ncbi:MAG: 6-carboxytetrahydropterin synthase QueD [Actinobacteria bacterium]|nr:6-carboxytetrahydropterin synthase QueD [Actinomycetota bacterium]
MYQVYKESDFSGAHHLRDYYGKCENIHGHNWKVRVYVTANELDSSGMVVDFVELKKVLEEEINRFDHQDINKTAPFDKINPTSENLAKYFFDQVSNRINNERVRVSKVMVWETEHSCAVYGE